VGVDLGKGALGNVYTSRGRLYDNRVMMTVTMPF
jgi:hypothetical protein